MALENKSYNYFRYVKLVWKKAFQETIRLYRTDLRVLISNVATALFTILALYLWRGQTVALDEGAIVIAGIFGFIGGFVIVFLINLLIIIPAKLYREQETEANKRSWKDIEINTYHFHINSGIGIGLEILSDKPREFQVGQVYCSIKEIKRGWDVIFRGIKELPLLYIPALERRQG